MAALHAMNAVEVAVRDASRFPNDLFGTELMREPLTDSRSRRFSVPGLQHFPAESESALRERICRHPGSSMLILTNWAIWLSYRAGALEE